MNQEAAIFDRINQSIIQEGRSSRDFHLPGGTDGKWDYLYTRTSPNAGWDGREAVEQLVERIFACEMMEEAEELMASFAAQHRAITAARGFMRAVYRRLTEDSQTEESLESLAGLGLMLVLNSCDIECVKYGLLLCAVTRVGERMEEARQAITIMGMCEEFTIFSVWNMLLWEEGAADLPLLGSQVSGWGQLSVLECMEPEDNLEELALMCMSILNRAAPQYAAALCWEKCGVDRWLAGGLSSPVEFFPIRELVRNLTDTREHLDEFARDETHRQSLELFLEACDAWPDWADEALSERLRAYLHGGE